MPNFVLFGQNGRITITAATFQPVMQDNGMGYPAASNIMEFLDEAGGLVGRVDIYQYGNIVREDALRENQ